MIWNWPLLAMNLILPKACCNTLTSACLFLNGYTSIYSFDQNVDVTASPSICGVGIYFSEKLPFFEVKFNNYSCVENIWIKITLRGQDSLLVGCIYRRPSSNPYQSTSDLCDLLASLQGYLHVLVCGDFNYPNINWSSLSCTTSYSQVFPDAIHDIPAHN